MRPTESNTPFFVVGCPRSGTTMFRLMLNEHSRLCVPAESFFITPLMDVLPQKERLSREQVAQALAIMTKHERWPSFGVADDEARAAVHRLGQPRLRDVIEEVFRLTCGHTLRWGDKTPPYVLEITRLATVFPTAKFIHVIRDCRDVCLSLHGAGWKGKNWNHLAAFWRDRVEAGIRDGRRLGPERYHEVRYEDLVLDTRATVRLALAFLDEPMEDQVCMFHQRAADHLAAREYRFHLKTMRPPAASDVDRWRSELIGLQVGAIEWVAGRVMDQVGQHRHFRRGLRAVGPLASLAIWAADLSRPLRRRVGLHLTKRSPTAAC